MTSKRLTHADDEGNPRMVDVTEKDHTRRTAVATGQSHNPHAGFVGRFDGFDDIGRVAGCGDSQQDITVTTQTFNLLAEDFFVRVVVADSGQCRAVRGQCDRSERRALHFKTIQQFRRKVLRIAG